jgi:hypothetical protein
MRPNIFNLKVQIWHANSPDGVLSAAACMSASIPLDIAADYTLRHTVEVEAPDDHAACMRALEVVMPTLPPLDPGRVRVIEWSPDRRTTAGDILIVVDSKTAEVRGVFLWRDGLKFEDFIRMQALPAALTGRTLH